MDLYDDRTITMYVEEQGFKSEKDFTYSTSPWDKTSYQGLCADLEPNFQKMKEDDNGRKTTEQK